LTLTPMMSARVLKPIAHEKHGSVYNLFERGFTRIANRYQRILSWALGHRFRIVGMIVVTLGLMFFFLWKLPSEFLPEEDKGNLLVFMVGPQGSTMEYSDREMSKAERIINEQPAPDNYFGAVGLALRGTGDPSQGIMFVSVKEK